MKNIYPLILLFLICSCQKDNDPLPADFVYAEPEINKYLERFSDEANKYGINIDLKNLSVAFVGGFVNDKYCGYGYSNYDGQGNPKIIISRKCWDTARELEKEGLVFHELGHAIMKRGHIDELLPDGSVRSIMGSNIGYTAYASDENKNKRDYYIAELFNEKEPMPEQAKEYTVIDTTSYFLDTIDSVNTVWDTVAAKGFEMFVDSIAFSSPPYGLSIVSYKKRHILSPAWELRIRKPVLESNQRIMLRAKITTQNLIGDGIKIYFPKKDNSITSIGYPRPDYKNVSNKVIKQVLENYNNIDDFRMRLEMMPETTGKVTFDDIELLILTERRERYEGE